MVGVEADEIKPLLDAVGGQGMYIPTFVADDAELERLLKMVEPYRLGGKPFALCGQSPMVR